MSSNTELWFQEIHQGIQSIGMKVSKVHLKKQSKYQEIFIFENDNYGTVMALDGALMLSDIDEHMYHHALTSYGMNNINPDKKDLNILVIGGGDGGIVRDLFQKYDSKISKVTLVEIDEEVINASKEFFPQIANTFNNPKLDLRCEDALKFIDSSPDDTYDLILCDSTDPEGFAAGLIEEDFYKKIKRALKADAIFCAQSGSPFFQRSELKKTRENLAKVFNEVHSYFSPMLVYPGSIWSYTAAANKILSKNNLDIGEFINIDDLLSKQNLKSELS